MSVDKFGRYSAKKGRTASRGPPGVGFVLTADGDYSIQHKCLKNVKTPNDPDDATTKAYVDDLHAANVKELQTKVPHIYVNKLHGESLNNIKSLTNKLNGVITSMPGMIESKIMSYNSPSYQKIIDLEHTISTLEQTLHKYKKSCDELGKTFEAYRRTTNEIIYDYGNTLTHLQLDLIKVTPKR